MNNKEFRKLNFINTDDNIKSFSMRASAIVYTGDKYLMVLNEGANKYKHPGGHLDLNETLINGLKRELKEEIGLEVDKLDTSKVFFDKVLINDNVMINALFQTEISEESANELIGNSPLTSKLFSLSELNQSNSWESELLAIKYFIKMK